MKRILPFIALAAVSVLSMFSCKPEPAEIRVASISLSSLKKIENGEIGTFDSLLRVLRTLGILESISALFMEDQMSPSEYYEMVNKAKKNTRKRAAGKILADKKYESEW